MVYKHLVASSLIALITACSPESATSDNDEQNNQEKKQAFDETQSDAGVIHLELWPKLERKPLDPDVETKIDALMSKMTLEQKVGQTIQADSASITPEEVKKYRLGSVLSGGNSAPGPLPYADAQTWLASADEYYNASIDNSDVEVAIPIIWGIDAVHGHANLKGAIVFPHNIGLGATGNPDLIEEISEITARELIVSGHDWTFAPTLAVPRDDRWGRAYEGFSENPELVASYAARIVYGLQGRRSDNSFMGSDRVISAAKHFLADGGTENGTDQGDAKISEIELRDIHAAGYLPALGAEVQSVMVSFSSWQGIKMTGNKELLTDVLKDRMHFQGFVVSDWNAHGQIPGCSNTECPEAFNAGIDMFMAPDSWRGLYESTLKHVKSGRISKERLDDAVRRILRVKIQSGLFEKGAPSERDHAGDTSLLGSKDHRATARKAVRESLVLLKNEGNILPLNPSKKILVIGDGADSIAKASGGWTLSWQGGVHTNDEFPNGQSILSGISDIIEQKGGSVIFDADGNSDAKVDAVIAVYGEDPYAEFQGDLANLDFNTEKFDTNLLKEYQAQGIPVVSVFLSGRPMWTNPEINSSNAFIAAWLPGSEGGGIGDMLFQTDLSFDFVGKLPFSWPKRATDTVLNVNDEGYDPLFPYGYGLTYAATSAVPDLPEDTGLNTSDISNSDTFFTRGRASKPWSIFVRADSTDNRITEIPWGNNKLSLSKTDRISQEDSLRINWQDTGPSLSITAFTSVDLTRQTNGAMELAFYAKSFKDQPADLMIGMGCGDRSDCRGLIPLKIDGNEWTEHRVNLSCFAKAGVDMSQIGEAFYINASNTATIGLSQIRLEADIDAKETCGDAGQ
jgi:beta-glucosidase